MDNTSKYLEQHKLPTDGLMEGFLHFGDQQLEKICEEALSKDKEIEFYYASNEDQLADKLSYRFIPDGNS